MARLKVIQRREDLLRVERWIERVEDCTQLEQRVRRDRKLHIVAQRDRHSVAFLDPDSLQATRQCIALSVELIVGDSALLMS